MQKSRAAAQRVGDKHYFTGEPCVRGHVAPRFTSIGKCMVCAREDAMRQHVHTTNKRRAYSDGAGFVAAATALHNGLYSYNRVNYRGAHVPVEITCSTHGAFFQSPTNHMQGQGCPVCHAKRVGDLCRKTTEEFVAAATAVWGDVYDYSSSVYQGAAKKLTIICRKHGAFEQTPNNHVHNKRAGCPRCNHMRSRGEEQVAQFLSVFATVERRNRALIAPKELDIYLPEHRIAIEYCGMYWHSCKSKAEERANRLKHFEKHQACKTQGIRLITLYESEWLDRQTSIKRLLRNAVGKSKGRLMARKCELRKVSNADARAFYDRYHPQGGSGHGEHYALFWRGKMVACMRFVLGANDRGHAATSRCWTLGRYATRCIVAGAASRLFKAFVREYDPDQVKSFSDNRFFDGGMYEQLGFALEAELPADYQVWSPKLGLRPKPHYQRRVLPKRLQEHGVVDAFDPETDPRTETEMTYLMGAGKLYDCGKKRWVWTSPS